MSQIHENPDLAVEIFVLEPGADGGGDGLVSGLHEHHMPGEEPAA